MANTKNLATVPSVDLSNPANLLAEVNGEIVRLPYSLMDERLVLKTEFSEYKISNDAELAKQKSDLTNETAELKAEIAVERERINLFTKLEEGNTTGDAELIDARVDHEGNIHDNVGEHIRTVTNQFSKTIDNTILNYYKKRNLRTSNVSILYNMLLTMINHNEFLNGKYYQTSNGKASVNSDFFTGFLKIENNTDYVIKAEEFAQVIALTANGDIVNESNNWISEYQFNSGEADYLIFSAKIIELDNIVLQKGTNITNYGGNTVKEALGKIFHNTNVVIVTNHGIDNTGNSDCGAIINELFANSPYGTLFFFPSGEYIIETTIEIPDGVTVQGSGFSSILKLKNGANCNLVNMNGCVDTIFRDFTLNGNYENNTQGDGICVNSNSKETGKSPNGTICNIKISEIAGNGMILNNGVAQANINGIFIWRCMLDGLVVEASDCNLLNFNISACRRGLVVKGSNNKFTLFKIDQSGSIHDYSNMNYKLFGNGLYCVGNRNTFTDVECQENYLHGFYLENCTDNILTNCLSDHNGLYKYKDPVYIGGSGFYLSLCERIILNVTCANYYADGTQYYGINLQGCPEITITANIDDNISEKYLFNGSSPYAIINGKAIETD